MLNRILCFVMVFALLISISTSGVFSAAAEDTEDSFSENETAEETEQFVLDEASDIDSTEQDTYKNESVNTDEDEIAGVGAENELSEIGANNTLASVKAISTNTEYQDNLSKSSEVDYFSFRLTSASKLSLNVRHEYISSSSTIWWFDILNSEGVKQARFYVHGNEPNYSGGNFGLPSGRYYLKVSANSFKSIPYYFKLASASAYDWETESNDTIATADRITVDQDYHGSLAFNSGDVDYYRLDTSSASRIRIVFKHALVDVSSTRWTISLTNTDGTELLKYYVKGNVSVTNTPYIGLPEGTFYIKIFSGSSSYDTNKFDYIFTLNSLITSVWETEPNNTMASADTITANKNYYGSMSGTGDVDYYKMTLKTKAKISIGFHHSVINSSSAYWRIVLLDTSGNQPLYLNAVGNKEDSQSGTVELAAGTYYIKVSPPYYSELTYRFVVNSDVQLSVPQITGFDSLDDGVKITWGKVTGAVKYRVYYYGSKGWTSMGDTTSTTFIDTDVGSGKTYTYSVQCVSADGNKLQSDMNTTGWKYTYNMATPKITNLYSTDKGVQIKWGKVKNASRYRVYYKNKNGNWVRMAELTGTSYLDDDVRWGGNYTYTVRCVNANGRFTSDSDNTGWKHRHYLTTPKITKITSSSKGVTLTWDKVSYAAKYRAYYLNRNGNWVKMGDTASTSFLDSDVAYGTTYTYTVRCVTSDGNTFTSDFDTGGWKHTYYLDTPQITGFSSVAKGVKISWKSVGAAKYRVYYYGSKGWTSMGDTASVEFIDDDVRIGKTYRYTVRAVKKDGSKFTSDCNTDGWKYTYDPKLSAPVIKECETVSNGVKIMWNEVSGAYKYRVYYRNKNGNWVKMGDTAESSFVDDVVKGGTTYTYSVRCLAAKSDEFASGYSSARSHTYVSAPSITKLTSEKSGVRISWSAPTGAKRYRVYYKNRNGNWVNMVETTSNTYLDADVKSGGNYTYTVRCIDANGSFTSWYDTTGWRCTYNYTDWSEMYKTYVNEHKNSMIWADSSYKLTNDTPLALHDFDGNGIPELIVGYIGARLGLSVYTIYNGKVVHAGGIGGKEAFYSDNTSYPGLFRGDTWMSGAEGSLGYYIVSKDKLVCKDVQSFTYNSSKKDFDITIHDKTLYNVYLDCSTYLSSVSRKPKYSLEYYYWKDVQSKGWNSFISKYGYR